jgi:hypothetical protein
MIKQLRINKTGYTKGGDRSVYRWIKNIGDIHNRSVHSKVKNNGDIQEEWLRQDKEHRRGRRGVFKAA